LAQAAHRTRIAVLCARPEHREDRFLDVVIHLIPKSQKDLRGAIEDAICLSTLLLR
jgi:hypothetical protein